MRSPRIRLCRNIRHLHTRFPVRFVDFCSRSKRRYSSLLLVLTPRNLRKLDSLSAQKRKSHNGVGTSFAPCPSGGFSQCPQLQNLSRRKTRLGDLPGFPKNILHSSAAVRLMSFFCPRKPRFDSPPRDLTTPPSGELSDTAIPLWCASDIGLVLSMPQMVFTVSAVSAVKSLNLA
ncbi:hypothetical protein B0H17DRAFT_1076905 [Mycena rosella]|uniref:Uncharacterized protein n=1 Tax=Mycena rosella TaxID=1033263 RepID=A0AAD7D5W4_MYCRO|nr:hypothetical protein B0H17DRAFT_1076905 [Mycena rosella]